MIDSELLCASPLSAVGGPKSEADEATVETPSLFVSPDAIVPSDELLFLWPFASYWRNWIELGDPETLR